MTKESDSAVVIIIPPSPFLADERVFPFLGPLRVAAQLQQNGNHVEVVDLSGFKNYEDIISDYVQGTSIRRFGITATTPQLPSAINIRNKIHQAIDNPQIILGGPHTTLTHAAYTRDLNSQHAGRGTQAFKQLTENFDQLVVGDGELAIFEALAKPDQKIIDAGNLRSSLFLRRGSIDNFSFPARELIDLDSYHYQIDGKRAFSVIGQLGCPFECGFCGGRDAQSFRMTRVRSVDNVIEEIESVVTKSMESGNPYAGVMFYDDELNVNPGSLESLCKGLIKLQDRLKMEMRFRGFVKAELFTEEQAKLMYDAGFRILLSGVESGSDEMLKTMRKHTSREINSQALERAQKAGLKFKALMSIGHPGESDTSIDKSLDWVLKNRPDDVDWTIITEYPGSPYFDHSTYDEKTKSWVYVEPKTGNRLWSKSMDYAKDAEYYKGIPGSYTAYVWTDYLSSDDLVKLRDHAEVFTRSNLKLPPIVETEPTQFEHSMGQGFPQNILRSN